MKINGSHFFDAPPELVWQTICDPAALKECIPQCEDIRQISPTHWQGLARVRLGPFKVGFTGDITLPYFEPPHHYRLHIDAHSRLGIASGDADVTLTRENGGTRLTYAAESHLGIKLLDNALSLADKVAKDLADRFFTRLGVVIAERRKSGQETLQ